MEDADGVDGLLTQSVSVWQPSNETQQSTIFLKNHFNTVHTGLLFMLKHKHTHLTHTNCHANIDPVHTTTNTSPVKFK